MKYCVYMPLWNDEDLVRVVLKHYETAANIVFCDAGSTDRGPEFALRAGREVRSLPAQDRLCDATNIQMKNSIWKGDVEHYDYVIVSDTDELLFFPDHPNDIVGALSVWRQQSVTHSFVTSYAIIFGDEEWQVALNRLPDQHVTLSMLFGSREDPILKTMGMNPYMYEKPLVFDPSALLETNFSPGQHGWGPRFVKSPKIPAQSPVMLHCRYLGQSREIQRTIASRERLRHQFHLGMGVQYNLTDREILSRTSSIYQSAKPLNIFPGFFRTRPLKNRNDFLVDVHGGADFISSQVIAGRVWEPTVAAAIAALCDSQTLFLDVGANLGLHTFTAALCGAAVLAYEPHPVSFRKLRRGVLVNGWQRKILTKQLAISDKDDEVLTLTDNLTNMGGSSVVVGGTGSSFPVRTKRLDTENLAQFKYRQIVIKLDVEGNEGRAIRGMGQLISKREVSAIIVELNTTIISIDALLSEVCAPIQESGFSDVRVLLKHPRDAWAGSPLEPQIPSQAVASPHEIRNLLSESSVLELLFLRTTYFCSA